jgi:8-oxo-dGTP pyrophosphatase MutT (NUDIX family)
MPYVEHDPPRERLLAGLRAHHPADEAERRDLALLLALVSGSARCFDRTLYDPGHVTGSAFIVDLDSGRVLLHHHRRLDRWLQLGGHDDGERDAAATALREGREESGLADLVLLDAAILDVDVHRIPAGRGEPEHLHHDVRYAVGTRAAGAIARDADESKALAWFPLEEAARLMDEPGATRALVRLGRLVGG